MSGSNTKASKIDRVLSRQGEHGEKLDGIGNLWAAAHTKLRVMDERFTAMADRLNSRMDSLLDNWTAIVAQQQVLDATNRMLTAHAASLEDENKRLRKYLGSALFQRRQAEAEPVGRICQCKVRGGFDHWRGPECSAPERQEPRWGNTCAGNPLPHTDAL